MANNLSGIRGSTPHDKTLFAGVIVLLTFAALFLGGVRPLPLAALEIAAVALLVDLFLTEQRTATGSKGLASGSSGLLESLSRPARLYLAMLLILPLVQLLPMPMGLWSELPGRGFYADAIRQSANGAAGFDWRAVSLVPSATESAWLALLPPLSIFLVTIRFGQERLLALVLVFLGIATAEALLGLIQYGSALKSDSAVGTYANRNHLAGLLEMALPVGLALLAATAGHRHARGYYAPRKRIFRQWLAGFTVERINRTAVLIAVSLAILLGLIFSRSRAGLGLGMLGILLCTLMFSYRLGGHNAYGLTGTFIAIGVGLASLIGLAPVWSRFAYSDPFEDGRWKIFDATIRAIGEFFPLGSGAGTFVEVLHRFHPADFPGVTINRAHNDYLEWLLEFGLFAAIFVAFGLVLYLRQWGKVWKRGEWTPFRFAQAGSGISLFLMMLHSLVDYNLRTPANAVFLAFLAGVFFHRTSTVRLKRLRRKDRQDASQVALTIDYGIPIENRKNPFQT